LSKRDTAADIPVIRIINIRLLSLSYHIRSSSVPLDIPSSGTIEGNVNLRGHRVGEKSFKVIISHELRANEFVCRMRHQARFASNSPITPEIFQSDPFNRQIVNKLMPFNSELLATLTGKTFSAPIVISSRLEFKKRDIGLE
jgi:hypothetical protein